jgi:uncharacterized membrane protein HdeD (DUF308 family)
MSSAASYSRRTTDNEVAAASVTFADNWWTAALRGVFAIAFGLIALFLPGVTVISLLLVFAVYSLADGIMSIILAIRSAMRGQRWMLLFLQGLLGVIVAPIVLLWPGISLIALILVIAAWSIFSGGLALGGATRLGWGHGRGWLIASAVASIVFGILLFIAPLIGALVLAIWIGAWAVVHGVTLFVLAYQLRARHLEAALRPQVSGANVP